MKILVINGPNLNLLGIREPEIYGNRTYADLVKFIGDVAADCGVEVEVRQTNHEGVIVDWMSALVRREIIMFKVWVTVASRVSDSI